MLSYCFNWEYKKILCSKICLISVGEGRCKFKLACTFLYCMTQRLFELNVFYSSGNIFFEHDHFFKSLRLWRFITLFIVCFSGKLIWERRLLSQWKIRTCESSTKRYFIYIIEKFWFKLILWRSSWRSVSWSSLLTAFDELVVPNIPISCLTLTRHKVIWKYQMYHWNYGIVL